MSNIQALFWGIIIFFIICSISLAEDSKTQTSQPVTNSDTPSKDTCKDNNAKDKGKNSTFSIFKESYVPVEQYKTKTECNIHTKANCCSDTKVINSNIIKLYEDGNLAFGSISVDEIPNSHSAGTSKFHRDMLKTQKLLDRAIYKQIIRKNYSKDLILKYINLEATNTSIGIGNTFPIEP